MCLNFFFPVSFALTILCFVSTGCMPPSLHLLAFSKDRSFQCRTLLHSLDTYLSPPPASLTVLYTVSSPTFLKGYQDLERMRQRGDHPGGKAAHKEDEGVPGPTKSSLDDGSEQSSTCIPTTFLHEDEAGGFSTALAMVLGQWRESHRKGRKDKQRRGREGGAGEEEREEEACVMWLVDDLLFHAPLDATPFLALLTRGRE
ncbi:hypothetical protein Naga_101466g1, partial [Nannochloropsis gaditana]